jgi:lysophospholipase L1-like esterase
VNASYSGSRVSGDHFPAASSPDRIRDLKTDKLSPDTILVYIGFNDYGYDVDPGVFELAYCRMLDRLQSVYPNAEIVCGTLMKTRIRGRENWHFPECAFGTPFEEFNDIIRRSCASCGCRLADLDALQTRYETLDGSHPTKTGHMEIAEAWLRCLLMPES